MKARIRLYTFLVAGVVLAGCATAGRKIDQSQVDLIQKGVSTQADVRAKLGDPQQVTRDADGNVTWQYLYSRATVKGESFIPFAGAFMGGVNTQNQSTTVKFSPQGVVTGVETTYGGTSVDQGLSAGGKPDLQGVK